jgi:hypothetical protein
VAELDDVPQGREGAVTWGRHHREGRRHSGHHRGGRALPSGCHRGGRALPSGRRHPAVEGRRARATTGEGRRRSGRHMGGAPPLEPPQGRKGVTVGYGGRDEGCHLVSVVSKAEGTATWASAKTMLRVSLGEERHVRLRVTLGDARPRSSQIQV